MRKAMYRATAVVGWLAVFLPSALAGLDSIDLGKTYLFVSGQGDYHTYRIPAMVVTKQGTVLAFCEGRKTSRKDHGDVDLVLRRSTDGGRSWSAIQLVYCPVCQAGLLCLPENDGRVNEVVLYSGPSEPGRTCLTVRRSIDGGQTWQTVVTLHDGPAAYSELVLLSDGKFGCLYERGELHPCERITFACLHSRNVRKKEP